MKNFALLIFTFVLAANPLLAECKHKVGAILPLTGGLSAPGELFRRGIELRLMEEDAKNFCVLFEDNKTFDRTAIVTAYRKLATVDKVPVSLVTAMPDIATLATMTANVKVPIIGIWDENDELRKLGPFVLSVGYSNENAGADIAAYTFKNLGVKRASIVSAHDEWSEIITRAFIKKFKELGGSIDLHETVAVDETEMAPIVLKIRSKKSPAVFFPLYLDSLISLIKKSKELNYKGDLVTAEGLMEPEIKVLGEAAEDVYAARIVCKDPEVLKNYKKQYKKDITTFDLGFVCAAYDAMTSAILGINENSKDTSQSLEQTLAQVEFDGKSGPISLAKQERAIKSLEVAKVTNGKLQL